MMMRLAVVLLGLTGGMSLVSVCYAQPDIDELKNAWRVQSQEIQSARITVAQTTRLVDEDVALNWEAAKAVIDRMNEEAARGDAATARQAIIDGVVALTDDRSKNAWPIMHIVVDGDNVRNIMARDGKVMKDWGFNEGTSVMYRPPHRQVDLEKGKSVDARYSIGALRFLPEDTIDWTLSPTQPKDAIALTTNDDGTTVDVLVDADTMILKRMLVPRFSDRSQGRIATFPGGISFPTYGVRVSFLDGRVRTVDAYILMEAEFNVPTKADLAIVVPEDTLVLDRRRSKEPDRHRTEQSGEAVAVANATLAKHAGPALQTWTVTAIVIGVILATAMLLLIVLWMRSKSQWAS